MSTLPNPLSASEISYLSLTAQSQISASSAEPPKDADCQSSAVAANLQSGLPEQVPSHAAGLDSSSPQRPLAGRRTVRKLHRIGDVRASQGVSERTMCRRLNLDVKQLRALEEPSSDLSLSMLNEIREALDVPLVDLLVESDGLSRPVEERAKLIKVMKTAKSIQECKLPGRASRLANMLCEQLIELMPELKDINGWPEFGSRREAGSVARILENEYNTSNLRGE